MGFLKKYFSSKKINEQNLKEENQQLREQLLHLNKLSDLGYIATSVAHEINNPIGAIQLCTENLVAAAQEDTHDFSHLKKEIALITEALDRISLLTKKMVHLGKNSKVEKQETFNPQSVIGKILELYHAKFSLLGITVETVFPEKIEIKGNILQVEQVLINLLNNACSSIEEAAKKIASLPMDFYKIKVTVNEQEIRVWNNGPSIPEEQQQNLFTPFTSYRKEGSGLGLAISKQAMADQSGDLYLAFSKESGTEFVLSFNREASKFSEVA